MLFFTRSELKNIEKSEHGRAIGEILLHFVLEDSGDRICSKMLQNITILASGAVRPRRLRKLIERQAKLQILSYFNGECEVDSNIFVEIPNVDVGMVTKIKEEEIQIDLYQN
jgi:hypothetical protein